WNEGPGYWGYTTMYTAFYLEALQTALGTMYNLEKTPGLSECGFFKIYATGPSELTFNFADAGEKSGSVPQMFWLAKTFKKPVYAWDSRQKIDNRKPFNMIWYSPDGQDPATSKLPLNKFFHRDNVVFLRSAWEKPDAMWVGFKGGDNKVNHSHLDIGSFVLDALGERWAVDLGPDDYNLPGYFGKARFTYFRLKTESHNTLLIDNTNQNTKAEAPIIAFSSGDTDGSVVANLSNAYPMTKSVLRGISLHNEKCVLIEDEVMAEKPVDVLWGIITRAKIQIDGNNAVLEQKGKRLYARILSPANAVFEKLNANPPPPERQQREASKLAVKLAGKITDLRLVVVFSTDKESLSQQFKPLEQWPGQIKMETENR
ncbi:MAG: heparinase II/III family protein, partial [Kiritimatiellae bacterium]|nr:heparinase II/III family protein [Kiritimatiellia bacterium]